MNLSPEHPSSLRTFRDIFSSEMVTLPRGRFVMGTGSGDEYKLLSALGKDMTFEDAVDEQPAHLVRIEYDFAMARHCVTFNDYDAYASATGAPRPDDERNGRGNMPVVNVTWDDAMRYAAWLAQVTGKPYRLPSEAEWEYAARAGTVTDYWWGDNADICNANYIDTPGGRAFPVNSLEPNPWGLYNMLGNVSEWVEDCFHESYFGAPADGSAWTRDYTWTDSVDDRVRGLRGGDYFSAAEEIRASYRGRAMGSYSGDNAGFRVAVTLG